MPWTSESAKRHKKMSNGESAVWAEVANKALHEYGDDVTAIKVANHAVNEHRHDHRNKHQFKHR